MEAFGVTFLLGLAAVDDIRTKRIRVLELIAFAILGLIIDIVLRPHSFSSIAGGLLVGVAVYIFSVISKEKIGKGDALLVMVASLYLGFINVVVLLWISSIMAAVFGVIYMFKNKKKADMEIPFVPFMLLAYLLMYTISMLGGLVIWN